MNTEELVCDVCEDRIPAVHTAALGYDGRSYLVNVCADHQRKLDRVLGQFIDAARPAPVAAPVDAT